MQVLKEELKTKREDIQKRGISYIKNSPFICYEYPTGLGKSYTAIMDLDYILTKNPTYKVLFLEPEIVLIENIKKEFIKFQKEKLLKNITIICYASLHKTFGNEEFSNQYEVIVADEFHHLFSEKRFNCILNQKNIKYFIGLSATINHGDVLALEIALKKEFLIHQVDLKSALDWDILPTPTVIIQELSLEKKKRIESFEFVRGNSSKEKVFTTDVYKRWKYIKNKKEYPNLRLIIKCTEKERYDQFCYERDQARKAYEIWKTSDDLNDWPEKKYLFSELKIKRYLSELKTKYLIPFLKTQLNKRFLAFVGSISQAEELKEAIPELNIINSKIKESNSIIEDFNKKKINNLVSVNKIQEGENLVDIETLIISQLDSNARSQIQRFGRGLRSAHPEIYIFYFKNTKDSDYLGKALDNFSDTSINFSQKYFKD